jgi:hypothetical protein
LFAEKYYIQSASPFFGFNHAFYNIVSNACAIERDEEKQYVVNFEACDRYLQVAIVDRFCYPVVTFSAS